MSAPRPALSDEPGAGQPFLLLQPAALLHPAISCSHASDNTLATAEDETNTEAPSRRLKQPDAGGLVGFVGEG